MELIITTVFSTEHFLKSYHKRDQVYQMCWFMEISMRSHWCYKLPLGMGIKHTKQMENHGALSKYVKGYYFSSFTPISI